MGRKGTLLGSSETWTAGGCRNSNSLSSTFIFPSCSGPRMHELGSRLSHGLMSGQGHLQIPGPHSKMQVKKVSPMLPESSGKQAPCSLWGLRANWSPPQDVTHILPRPRNLEALAVGHPGTRWGRSKGPDCGQTLPLTPPSPYTSLCMHVCGAHVLTR